jgi:hypothetical protein
VAWLGKVGKALQVMVKKIKASHFQYEPLQLQGVQGKARQGKARQGKARQARAQEKFCR